MIPDSLKRPPTISVKPDEVRRLDDFLKGVNSPPGPDGTIYVPLSKRQLELIRIVSSTFIWLIDLLSLKKVGIGIIRKVLNINLPSSSRKNDQDEIDSENNEDENLTEVGELSVQESTDESSSGFPLPPPEGENPSKVPRTNPNHPGRRTSKDLKDPKLNNFFHSDLAEDAHCPNTGCRGRVYIFLRDGKIREVITFDFSPPFIPTVHRMHDLRCNCCFRVYKAVFSKELILDGALQGRYLYPAKAALVLLHYGMGFPMYRLDQFQSLTGERFPESTQFDLLENVADVFKTFKDAMIRTAADGFLFQGDDVGNRVLDLVPELKERRSDGTLTIREGVHTSHLISTTAQGNLIPVLKTGINHFGELLDQVLGQRSEGIPLPDIVCDGSKVNQTFVVEARMGGCWQHLREYFIKAGKNFPIEADFFIKQIKLIFEIDRQTHEMGAEERLVHLKELARPIVDKIQEAVDGHCKSRLILPKSELGQALGYFNNQYDRLLLPFTHPGVPIHNNLSEWCTYLVVRLLVNSKFFRSRAGAAIGDTLLMIILFAYLSHTNPYEFILYCLRHQTEMKKNPEAFFPWNLRDKVGAVPPHKQMRFWAPAPPANRSE